MCLGTNHWLSVGTAAAESETGEQDAGRTTESQGQNTGQVYSQDTCSVVPTLTARLLGSALEGGPSGGGTASLSPSSPGGGSSFLPLITLGCLACHRFALTAFFSLFYHLRN